MKQKIYIAGKVTGLERTVVENNFNTLKEYFTQKGFEVVSPIDIVTDPATEWKAAMKICIAALIDCDFIYPMRNAYESKGAKIEIEIAKLFDILVIEPVDIDNTYECTSVFDFNLTKPAQEALLVLQKVKRIREK